jgi:tRNA U34 5-methylaminomethyl-2-thiouridine-forming methyltransferase MnmC
MDFNSQNQLQFSINPELIITADGSHTLKIRGLNEQYHSTNGAIQESNVVYIQNGFYHTNKQEVKILEIGFGTGLNCLLTYCANESYPNPKTIDYTAIEPFPIAKALVNNFNYPALIDTKNAMEIYTAMHEASMNKKHQIANQFYVSKIPLLVQDFIDHEHNYDLIYFDAFGPAVQPEMWTKSIFDKMYSLLKTDGILVTYCAKGEVKRTLKAAGFTVESLAGPPGKREVSRAIK